jgi:hypothetical protein
VLVKALDSGNFRVAEALVASERDDVNDSFFVTLFQILAQNPEMTATEVVERISEKASLISPTQGFLQSEMLGPIVDRELEMLDELGIAPTPPPEVIEAGGGYEVMYTSPWAKGQYAEEISGFMRAFDFAARAAEIMQDASPLDPFKLEVAIPEMAQRFAAPERWIGDDNYAKGKADARAEQQAAMAAMQNAAGLGSAAKAVTEAQSGAQPK